ncbi:hypothetical protein Btru_048647 [Bulinus truncatus]|nr:hypothetical protein Btru_048647 [Bulinus truncatus]
MANNTAYTVVKSDDHIISGTENSGTDVFTKEKKCCWLGFGPCSLLFLLLITMFLIGLFVGFYVKELDRENPSVTELCQDVNKNTQDYDVTKFVSYHDTLVYSILGENIAKFVDKFGTKDPVTGSETEVRLADEIQQEFNKYRFTDVDVEEYDIVIPSADPARPNRLEILHHNGTRQFDVYLTNKKDKNIKNSPNINLTTPEWQNPFVAFSPPGEVQGYLVYGHYGRETDFKVLEAHNVSSKDKIVLLRLGRIPVANKVFNVESYGGKAALFYWEPEDATSSHIDAYNLTYIPFASATQYSTELPDYWKPLIPCQTISANHARLLMSHLAADTSSIIAPDHWQGSVAKTYYLGGTNELTTVRLTVNNKLTKKVIKNIVTMIPGQEELDRYIVVSAPRTALPGQPQDAIISSSLLIQLAHAFHLMYRRHNWKPAQGVKLISWGGQEFSNLGALLHLQKYHHLLEQRAVAYFDLAQTTLGNDILEMQSPLGFHQTIEKIIDNAVDPKTGDFTLSFIKTDDLTEPYNGSNCESSSYFFLTTLNLHSIKVQYKMNGTKQNSVSRMLEEDKNHHFKYHIAVAHILIKTLLTLLDTPLLQRDICSDLKNLQTLVHITSDTLEDCSESSINLSEALELFVDMERACETLKNETNIFTQKFGLSAVRMFSDIRMLFDRHLIINKNGFLYNILYPSIANEGIAGANELCVIGEKTQTWNAAFEFKQTLLFSLKKMLKTLILSS